MSIKSIGIIDYGLGNLASVKNSLKKIGYRVKVSNELDVLNKVDMLILPGVGAYPKAMRLLGEYGLINFIKSKAKNNLPILGICLGMQLLAESSTEQGNTAGLGLISGKVTSFKDSRTHVGWNAISILKDDSMMKEFDSQFMYFNHSYYLSSSKDMIIANSIHEETFPAIIKKDNIIGVQFHPEKSQKIGFDFLKFIINRFSSA